MSLKQLRLFLAVLRAGSLTAASRTLHVAQPAIGVQIGLLENELGVALLVRHSRGVAPTQAGALLARHAERLVDKAERMRRDIMEMGRDPRGRIALGMTGTAVRALGGRLVEACRRDYPDLNLTLTEGEGHWLADGLAQGRLDMAVTCEPPANAGAASEALAAEPLYFVAPPGHALAQGRDVALRLALDADLVLPPKPSTVRKLLAEAARASGAELRSVCESESVAWTKALVRLGVACAVMPCGAVRREAGDGRLAARPIANPRLVHTLYMICSESRAGTRALEAVRRKIRALAAELVGSCTAGWTSCIAGPVPASGKAPQGPAIRVERTGESIESEGIDRRD